MPIKYIPFFPDPIEGQAILDNFKRTLKYKGSYDITGRLKRGMPLYEMEKQETVGENKDGNLVIRGECVSACAYLKEQGIFVDLVYIDPPFASGADYAKKVYIRKNPKVAEAIVKAEEELDVGDAFRTFEETMYGDVWDKEKYLNWMYENLMAIKSVMSETGSIYVHLDWHIGHYVKILLDEIFGEHNFRNEIIWCYKTSLRSSSRSFGRDHDSILFYAVNDTVTIHPDKSDFPASESTLKRWGDYADEDGFVSNKHFAGSESTIIDTTDETKGFNINNGIPRDWWELSANVAKGNTDEVIAGKYATQKPLELLNRIIKSSSDDNMVIADFFGGSGVASVAANKLGRRFIHCDIGINSIQTTRDRLVADKAEFDILEIKDGVSLYRNPQQTMDKIKSLISGLKNDGGLDNFWDGSISDSKLGSIPVYVPNLMDSSTKLLDEVLMNRILHEAVPDLNSNVKKVIVYYIDVTDKAEIEKFIKEDDSTIIDIELRDLKEVLDDVVVEDYAEFSCEQVQENLLPEYKVDIKRFMSDRVNQKIDAFNQKAFANSSEKKPYNPIIISEYGLELIEFISLDCTDDSSMWHSDSEIKIDKLGYMIVNGIKIKDFWDGSIKSDKEPLKLKIRNICGDETVHLI